MATEEKIFCLELFTNNQSFFCAVQLIGCLSGTFSSGNVKSQNIFYRWHIFSQKQEYFCYLLICTFCCCFDLYSYFFPFEMYTDIILYIYKWECKFIFYCIILVRLGGRRHWAVYYSSHQSFLIRWLNNFGDFLNFDWFLLVYLARPCFREERGLHT